MTRSTLMHLRIPFSYFLMPIFLFAVAVSERVDWGRCVAAFVLMHLFLYPAANAYNSYYDRDVGSIGVLKRPPPVSKDLLPVSLLFDGVAIIFGLLLSWQFAAALLIYGIFSKAYSHDRIRWKKKPIAGWLGVGAVQGAFTFLMVSHVINAEGQNAICSGRQIVPACLASLSVLAAYPLTQVYQHAEDCRRGDKTLSMLLGVRGTFQLSAFLQVSAAIGFCAFLGRCFDLMSVMLFVVMQIPAFVCFVIWFREVSQDERNADFERAMRLSFISATGMNLFCVLFYVRHQIA